MRVARPLLGCCAAILGALFPGAPRAAGPTAGDFARLPALTSPSISPDGRFLALAVHNSGAKWSESDYQLVVLRLPGLEGVSRLNMAPFYRPARIVWVSNTRVVVALAYSSGSLEQPRLTGEIVAVDYDGGHKQTLYTPRRSDADAADIHAHELPDGVAYINGVPVPRNGHVYLDLAVWPERFNSDDRVPVRSQVYDVDSLSGKATLLGDIDQGGMSFVVSRGVARIAYGEADARTLAVYVRADGTQPWRRLEQDVTGRRLKPLAMSRDGARLWSLYSAAGGPEVLAESDPAGGERRVLAADDFASIEDVQWDAVTGAPYAAVVRHGRPRVVYLGNGPHARILKALNDKFADHLVTIIGMDEAGSRLLVHATSDRDPGSVALFDTASGNLRPLYRTLDWVSEAQMSERRPFRFRASDGLELDGFLTLPAGRAPQRRPSVLLPHGGPIGPSDDWAFDSDAQFLASLGYTVVQVNYRGSGGRGPDFEDAGLRHFGDRIQQDLLDGLRWAVEQGYADGARVCVYGASFGGYASLLLPILSPGTFRCAIDYAGVSDWTIEFRSSDTSHSALGRGYLAEALGDEAAARAISPLYRLDAFSVPVLIVHGEADERVPVRNARALRAALEKSGKPFEWLVKPKEGHGFYSEANRAELYRRMQQFLDAKLGH